MFSANLQALRRRIFDRFVLRPSRDPIDFGSQQRVMLPWGQRSEQLECFVHRVGDQKEPLDLLIIKFPGTAGRAERSTTFPAGLFADANAEIWTWNPPGYGRSTGRASMARIENASLEFWRHVIGSPRIADTTRVWIVGNSLGCVTALHVAADLTMSHRLAMVLRNPPPLSDVVKHVASRYPMSGWVGPVADSLPEQMNAAIVAGRVQLPAVFLQSERDELVLPEMQQKVIDAYAGPMQLVVLEGLKHGGMFTEAHEPKVRAAIEWLWQQSGLSSAE